MSTASGIPEEVARVLLAAQSDRDEADAVVESVLLDGLADAADRMQHAKEIRDALIDLGLKSKISRASLAKAAGVSVSRLYQIHNESRP